MIKPSRKSRRAQEIAEGAAAYDAMFIHGKRPLAKPKPLNHLPRTRSAGELALAREIRRGEYEP